MMGAPLALSQCTQAFAGCVLATQGKDVGWNGTPPKMQRPCRRSARKQQQTHHQRKCLSSRPAQGTACAHS
jgi:hypothetical protein